MNYDFPWVIRIPSTGGAMLFEVDAQELCELNIQFSCFWDDPQPGSNLMLVIKGENLDETEAKSLGFHPSEYGYYKYVRENIQDGMFQMCLCVAASVSEIWLVPFCTKQGVYVKALRSQSSGRVNVRARSDCCVDGGLVEIKSLSDVVAINANILKFGCGGECCIHYNKWFDSMDGFASRWGMRFSRDSVILQSDRECFPVVLHRGRPALLTVPRDISQWLYEIGDKSRNMISKARRNGYCYKEVELNDVAHDIYEIRTSDPMRQGRKIPEYFYTNPPQYVVERSKVRCAQHDEIFVGVFLGDKLVSYITMFLFGQLAEINQILCHAEHISNGVMNYNLYCAVVRLIECSPEVRYLNYMYVDDGKNAGVDLFKKSMGFKSRQLYIYDGMCDFPGCDSPVVSPVIGEGVKESLVTKRIVKKTRVARGDKVITGELMDGSELSSYLAVDASRIVFKEAPLANNFVEFWSSGVRAIAKDYPIGMLIAIQFPSKLPENDEYGIRSYLERRFKMNHGINPEGLRCGFKGGEFRAVAFLDLMNRGCQGEGLIVVEKVASDD